MAKLNKTVIEDSEDEFPDLTSLLGKCSLAIPETPAPSPGKVRSFDTGQLHRKERAAETTVIRQKERKPETSSKQIIDQDVIASRKQRRLYVASGNAVRLLPPKHGYSFENVVDAKATPFNNRSTVRSSPRRAVKTPIDYSKFAITLADEESSEFEDDQSLTDLSGFIVSDSENVEEDAVRDFKRIKQPRSPTKASSFQRVSDQSRERQDFSNVEIVDITFPQAPPIQSYGDELKLQTEDQLNFDEPQAILTL